jgi:hypothetical protein
VAWFNSGVMPGDERPANQLHFSVLACRAQLRSSKSFKNLRQFAELDKQNNQHEKN